MTFANFCIYLLSGYLLYYFGLFVWDSIFNAKKTEKPEEIQLDISGSASFIDETPQTVNESDYLIPDEGEKKK